MDDDSDEEFQKFLQESLSSSAASYLSELSKPRNSSAGEPDGSKRYHEENFLEEPSSDKELEAAAQSWLKASGPLGKSQTMSIDITLPTEDYSKDSLEASKGDGHTNLSISSKSSGSKIYSQDIFSTTASTAPGLDTLEEKADKERFFAELEENRNTPLDYSELNRQLENTGKSFLPDNVSVWSGPKEGSEEYEEDFDSTVTTQSKSLSSRSGSTLTPTSSSIEVTAQTSNMDGSTTKPPLILTLGSKQGSESNLNESGSSTGSVHSTKRLLDRSSVHRQISDHLRAESEFSLSPIHSHPSRECKGQGDKDTESPNESGHSTHEQRLLAPLTLIHHKDAPPNPRVQTISKNTTHAPESVSLTPLHVRDKTRRDAPGPPGKTDKQPTPFSTVKEPIVQSRVLTLPVKHSLRDTEQRTVVPSLQEARLNISSSSESSFSAIRMAPSPKKEADIDADVVIQSGLPEDSVLEEFNELQDALKAAGLPQLSEAPPHRTETVERASTEESQDTKLQDGMKSPNHIMIAPIELMAFDEDLHSLVDPIPVDRDQENVLEKSRTHSVEPKPQPKDRTDSSKTPPHPGPEAGASKKSMLREALRVIANEELTTISRGLLYATNRTKSLPPEETSPLPETEGSKSSGMETPHSSSHQIVGLLKESTPSEASKLTAHIPLGSKEGGYKLADELEDILGKREQCEDYSHSQPAAGGTLDDKMADHHTRPKQSFKLSSTQSGPTVSKTPSSERAPLKRPFQVSSRLYPGPKAPPKAAKQGGPKTLKSTLSSTTRPPKRVKRVSRQSPPAESVPISNNSFDTRPAESVATSNSTADHSRNSSVVCSHCVLERGETERWRKAWQEEKDEREQLARLVEEVRCEAQEKEKQGKAQSEEEKSELKQELYTLSVKLKELEANQTSRKLLARGGDVGKAVISREEKEALRTDIQEQEVLLQGYQKENEKLYSELSKLRKELKASQSHLYEEKQQLRKKLLNARSEAERHPQPTDTKSAQLGASRIAQLEDKLEQANEKCSQLDKQVTQLKHTNSCLEGEMRKLTRVRQEQESRARRMVDREELDKLKDRHKMEVSRLSQKLEWYAENQAQLDRDCEQMRAKDRELASLRETLATLEAAQPPPRRGSRTKARGVEARKVAQLEKQVRELEKVIQKRFPNSLSALILASSREPDATRSDQTAGPGAPPTYLERRVQQLEALLEERERESGRSLRALQQKYNAMELSYEKQLAALRDDTSARGPPPLGAQGVTTETGMGGTLSSSEGKLTSDLVAVRSENDQLRKELAKVSFEADHQKAQLQGKLAETETSLARAQETAQEELQREEKAHKTTVDSLLARLAKEQSDSQVTQLSSQLAAREATIRHLRERVECLELSEAGLREGRSREEQLTQQVKLLTEQLIEAKRHHTPEMQHFLALQAKIASLEDRCAQYQDLMQEKWTHLQPPASHKQLREQEKEWRRQLNAKDAEIERFRQELDRMMAALQVLQQRGSMARPPTHSSKH